MPAPRVDFYLISDSAPDAHLLVCCRLLEKAYLQQHKVYVEASSQQEAETLDELLWTFKEECFIPHNLQGEGPKRPPPIQIGWLEPGLEWCDILLSLKTGVAPYYKRFRRVIEIVPNEETIKTAKREDFRWYKQQQWLLQTHTL